MNHIMKVFFKLILSSLMCFSVLSINEMIVLAQDENTTDPSAVAVTKIDLDHTALSLDVGGIATLKATVAPDNATDKTLLWTTDKEAVATVSDGVVTAVAAGTAVITVTDQTRKVSATCTVTVSNPVIPVSSISLNKNSLTLVTGSSETLTITVLPDNATDKTVQWMSSNPATATVSNGQITAVSSGEAVITAVSGGASASCTVKVVAQAEGFVYRLYRVTLNRDPDQGGLETWIYALNHGVTGSSVAYQFFFSQEFLNKNYCDEHYVKYLYETLMNREPDSTGYNNWLNALYHGISRESVINGFLLSQEFTNICASYGINRGNGAGVTGLATFQTQPCSVDGKLDTGIGQFAARLYEKCLGRSYDNGGLGNWINALHAGLSGTYAAYQFFFSTEYKDLANSDDEYITRLYRTLFDREPDAGGKTNWLNYLVSSTSRYSTFQKFADSAEWKTVCANYGIQWESAHYTSDVPPFYSQGDPAWSHAMFGGGTIGMTGCGVTSMAMIIQAKTGNRVTPFEIAAYLHSIGEFNSGNLIGTDGKALVDAGKRYGLSCDYVGSYEELVSALQRGKLVAWQVVGLPFALPLPGHSHALVLYGYENGNTHVLDPNDGKCNGSFSVMQLWNQRSTNPVDLDIGVPGVAY